jgi:hypothetical protein
MINTLNMMGSSDRGEGLMEEDKSTIPSPAPLLLIDVVCLSLERVR